MNRLASALAACSLLTASIGTAELHAQVLPSGMTTIAGQATASTRGGTLTVSNSPNAIIHWNSFSIGAGNGVRFEQADASSQVLNRVMGRDPSSILGSLSSNGRVWLLNPNGVLFGQGARVDVASLVTSTLNLNDSDWLYGRARFIQGPGAAADVVNLGELRSSMGGHVALIGGQVRNEGTIDAAGGRVLLAAGTDVELLDSATPNVRVRLNAGPGQVHNLGSLLADGGQIDVHAASVNQTGIVRADSLAAGPAGEVVLHATDRLTLDGDSRTSAVGVGDQGGHGGQIRLLGREVALLDRAQVDASGRTGGGVVLVGGGTQGQDPTVPNAQAVYFGLGSRLAADATEAGDGGRIVLWSDRATRAYGSLSARGGPARGNGGFIETSGGWLDARPSHLDLSAPKGSPGHWLLDPFNVTINDAGPDTGYDTASFTANASGTTISTAAIRTQLDQGFDVTVSTGGGAGPQAGNISMSNATLIVTRFQGPGNLALIADGNITLTGSTIANNSGSGAPMTVSLLAGRGGGDGGISLQNSSIGSGGGNITLGGFGTGIGISGPLSNAAFSNSSHGVLIDNSSVGAGFSNSGGTLSIIGASGGAGFAGVALTGGSVLSAKSMTIMGSSSAGNGVTVNNADLSAYAGIAVQGLGALSGVIHSAGSTMLSSPGVSGSAVLGLVGQSMGGASGVIVAGPLTANNGDSVSVSGGNMFGSTPAVLVTAPITVSSNPATLTLGIINPSIDNSILVDNTTLSVLNPGLQVFGARSLTLRDTTVTSRVSLLEADNITFQGATSISSNRPTGDVMVLTNRNGGPLTSFSNNSTAGSGTFQTQGGRWIIWASDITAASFSPGALANDFTLYGATAAADWSALIGNGFVSAAASAATVTGTVNPKVYDATQVATLQTALAATGPRGEVGVFGSAPAVQFVDKNVGPAKPTELTGSYTVTFTDSLGKPVYGLTLASDMTADITRAPLVISGLTADNKAYDATVAAALSGTASFTPLGSDTVTVSSTPVGTFADKNVGTGKPVTLSVLSLTGTDAGNYTPVAQTGLTANITPASAQVTGVTANDKVYDATVTATLSGVPTVAALGTDVLTVGGTPVATFTSKDVDSAFFVNVSGYTLGGADAGNYTLAQPSGLSANITPAPLTVSGLVASNKVYDATRAATISGTLAVLPLGSDAVTVGGTPSALFADKNVGTGKSVQVTGLSLGGNDASNYQLTGTLTTTANITPAPLTIGGLTANDKTYDGTRNATLGGSATASPLGNDLVSVSGTPAGLFNDKNVGSAKPVAVVGLTLAGADAGNYTAVASSGLTADITPATVQVSGLTVRDKVYDATVTATLGGGATVNALGSDVVTIGAAVGGVVGAVITAQFVDKNVGQDKAVTVSGLSLTGADAGNYRIASTLAATADITPAPLTVTGLTAVDKVYDATRLASVSGTAAVSALGSDVVAVSGTAAVQFADKNVGTAKAVQVSGLTLSGTDAGNYTVAPTLALTANITPAALTVSGLRANAKVYDATRSAVISGTGTVTPLGSDVVAVGGVIGGVVGGGAQFADKNVGQGKAVTISGLTLTGADAGNYAAVPPTGLTADITPAPLAVTGLYASDKVYDATRVASLSGTPAVIALGSDVVTVSGAAAVQFADKNVGTGKAVQVSGLTLSGTDAGNYTVAPTLALTANITPAALTVSGLSANPKVYDATRSAVISGTGTVTPLGSDVVAVGGVIGGTVLAQFADKNAGQGKAVTISGLTLTGADAGNYTALPPTGLAADITPAVLRVGGLLASNKIYDATRNATVTGTTSVTPLAGDVVAVGGTAIGQFADKDVGTGKSVQISGLALSGPDGGNYQVAPALTATADITPATLTYVAQPVSVALRSALPPLTGTVTGFVGGESVQSATNGTLVFSTNATSATSATSQSVAGLYPVLGSGLSAANYRFVQDPANSQALTLRPAAGKDEVIATRNPETSSRLVLDLALRPVPRVDLALGGVLDLVPSPPTADRIAPPATGAADTGPSSAPSTPVAPSSPESLSPGATRAATAFESVPLADMSTDSVVGLLGARSEYKRALLADARTRLEADPTLADMPPCRSRDELLAGGCVMTEALKRVLKLEPASVQVAVAAPSAAAMPAPPAAATPPALPAVAAVPPVAPTPTATPTPTPAAAPAAAPQLPVAVAPQTAPAAAASPAPAAAPAAAQVLAKAPAAQARRPSAARRVVSASLPQIQRKVALVIGVDRYQDEGIPTLANAVGDARAMGQVLESQMGYETVVLENATRSQVVAALNLLTVELGPRDSVMLYYAGHGEVVDSTKLGYWLLADSKAKQPETWLSNTDIARMLAQVDASQVALISDSCYSGSLVTDQRIRAAVGSLDPVQMLARKSVVVMSSGGNEPVADSGKQGHSPFAWSLLNNLRQLSAWQPGGNVFERVRFAVARELPQRPQYGAFTAGGHQGGIDYLFEQRKLDSGTP